MATPSHPKRSDRQQPATLGIRTCDAAQAGPANLVLDTSCRIPVRIDPETRKRLKRISKANDVSIGAIVPAALEAVPAKRGRCSFEAVRD